jgi:PIN domain nuclease of toxin-antitoxin system
MSTSEVLDFLNKNSGALTVLFTAVVTISTVAYSILTGKLVSETTKMRQVQTEPKIEIMIKPLIWNKHRSIYR